MYICQICKKVISVNKPSFLIPFVIRKKHYPFRAHANKFIDPNKPGKKKIKHTDDPGGVGHETVKEIQVCENCKISADPPKLE